MGTAVVVLGMGIEPRDARILSLTFGGFPVHLGGYRGSADLGSRRGKSERSGDPVCGAALTRRRTE